MCEDTCIVKFGRCFKLHFPYCSFLTKPYGHIINQSGSNHGEAIMKALVANVGVKNEAWYKVKTKFFRNIETPAGINLELVQTAEPANPAPHWIKVRSVYSAISDFDEALFIRNDWLALSGFLSFPFVPGCENIGIITEVGQQVQGVELGERVVVNPVIACRARGITPLCDPCSSGNYSMCRNFWGPFPGPGMMIGACKNTSGGWADSFLAHESQVRTISRSVETNQMIMVPEFTRALRAVLQHPPAPNDTIIIIGAGSLGLLTLTALNMLGYHNRILVLAEHSFEEDRARATHPNVQVGFTHGHGTAFEFAGDFLKKKVQYVSPHRPVIAGGADLVYETTGIRDNVEDALYLAGEEKKVVVMGMKGFPDVNMTAIMMRGIRVFGTSFSGTESQGKETFDIALEMTLEKNLPITELVTHRFMIDQYREALTALENRAASKAIKAVFQHIV